MAELTSLVAHFGLPTVAGAVALYVILRSEVSFRYPEENKILKSTGAATL